MSPSQDILKQLDDRRIELGMSIAALAHHAGLSKATVQKALRGRGTDSFDTMRAIDEVVGIGVVGARNRTAGAVMQRQAQSKAKHLVELVAGNSALENHRITVERACDLERVTAEELLRGAKLALWA